MPAEPKLKDIAARIGAHLRRFEADPVINAPSGGRLTYYRAGASSPSGRTVAVWYVAYMGRVQLKRPEATAYLAWLDAGNVGTHWDREAARG